MKNIYFLFVFAIFFISCKKDKEEDPQPVSKDGVLEIEYTATLGSGGYSEISLVNKTTYELPRTYTTPTNTTANYTTSVSLKGNQKFEIIIHTYRTSGATSFTGNYTIKASFDGTELLNESYSNSNGSYSKEITLPFKN